MDEIWELWMMSCFHEWKIAISFSNPSALGWAIGYGWCRISSPCLHRRISECVKIYCFIIHHSSKEQKGCQTWSPIFIHEGAMSSIMSRLCPWVVQLWLMINERRVENEPRQWEAIHLLQLFIGHNQSAHGQNMGNMDDIMPSRMKICNQLQYPFWSWMSDKLWVGWLESSQFSSCFLIWTALILIELKVCAWHIIL